jgi:hypothetical protein
MSPLRRFETPAQSRILVAEVRQPLVKLAALQSVVRAAVPGLLVTRIPPMPRRFRRTVVVFHPRCPPSSCNAGFILSYASLSSRVPSGSHLLEPRHLAMSPRAPPLGFLPSSRRHHEESTHTGHPEPDFVPPAAFRTLSTVCSSSCLAHLFRCAAVSRVLAPGVCSSDRAAPPRGGRYPLAVGGVHLPVARRQRTSRRPQGLRPDRNPRCDPRPLLRFQLPRACLQRPWKCRRTSSARDLHRWHTRAPQVDPQRLDRSLTFASVPRGSSRSSFLAQG